MTIEKRKPSSSSKLKEVPRKEDMVQDTPGAEMPDVEQKSKISEEEVEEVFNENQKKAS